MKVLIAAPIANHKLYSFKVWMQYLWENYPNHDVLLCVNGHRDKVDQIVTELSSEHPSLLFIANKYDGSETIMRRLYEARSSIITFAVKHKYDAVWFLDTDTIPQIHSALEMLITAHERTERSVISGVYCYKKTRVPVLLSETGGCNATLDELRSCFERDEYYYSAGAGFGCLLITRQEFDVPFDKKWIAEGLSEDFAWFVELHKKYGASETNPRPYKMPVVPILLCKHLGSDLT